jgi:hypothetical protein
LVENSNLNHSKKLKDILTPIDDELKLLLPTPKDSEEKFGIELRELGDLEKNV